MRINKRIWIAMTICFIQILFDFIGAIAMIQLFMNGWLLSIVYFACALIMMAVSLFILGDGSQK